MSVIFETSPAAVASEALGQLGRAPITDLDDTDDPVAVQCKQYFVSLLRAMLRDHPWNFAKDRVQLAQNATAPISDWTYAYALPADCFRVLQVNNDSRSTSVQSGPPVWPTFRYPKWEIEGRNLLTDESTVIIEYIKWVDDPNIWDGMFHQAFVTFLAVRLAPALNTDKEKASDLFKLYQMQLLDAKAVDGQENPTEQMTCSFLTDDIRE